MAKASLEERERLQREAEEKLFREAKERRERELREEEERIRKQKELEKAKAAPAITDIRSTFEVKRPTLDRAVTLATSSHAVEAQSTHSPFYISILQNRLSILLDSFDNSEELNVRRLTLFQK